MNEKKNKQSLKQVWRNNMYLTKLSFKTAPGYMFALIVEFMRNEISIFLEFTIGFAFVLESVEFGRSFGEVAKVLLLIFVFVAVGLFYNAVFWNKIRERAVPKIERSLKEQLYAKAKEIDLGCYDNPEFYNNYILAVSEAGNQINRNFDIMSKLVSGLTGLTLASGYFIVKDPRSFVFVAASFFMMMLSNKLLSKLNFKIRTERNPLERKLGYTNRVFYLNDYAKEMRLNTEVSREIMKDYDETLDKTLAVDKKYAKRRLGFEFLKNYVAQDFIIDILFLAYLVYSAAVLRTISYSQVAVLRGTAATAKWRLGRISEVYGIALEVSLYMERIQSFLDTEAEIVSAENRAVPETPTVIELKNVSFSYGENDYVLKNINMTINPLSKIAIVGYNGAGKTTLIKLIMRLYEPNEGEILLDGVNIKDYEIEDYRRKIGTVFQDFKIFAATVKENVLLDFAENGSDADVCNALEKSGFSERLNSLSGGLESNLTTEFEENGVNLSGGEGQKLAVARVFYAGANLIILDEPSSALDPIAEYHLNCSMLTAAENKSVLFISHRLSTTRIADKIYMLEDGEIIEEGSHGELLKSNGKYAEMWRVQAGQYL
ncbi:MAG: ABC transporter ATP-binding protein/permease [Oscillospiraceae bacterium]|nr:ABC transporter ATP-binding protein/permease [Oscillospiraceae bacterium]